MHDNSGMHWLTRKRVLFAVVVLALALPWPLPSQAQDTLWNTWRQGGLQALHEGRLADAERLLTAALEQAEKYGLDDLRVADAANDLAVVYANSGKPLEAELISTAALAAPPRRRRASDHPGA